MEATTSTSTPTSTWREAGGAKTGTRRQLLAGLAFPGTGDGLREVVDLSTSAEASARLVADADRASVTGALLDAVVSGAVRLTPAARSELGRAHRSKLTWCLLLEQRLVRTSRWFAEAGGIDFRVVKGPAIAHLDEPDPARRTFSDIDLLVRADHLERALEVLAIHGATRPYAERRPGFDRRFAKSVTLTFPDRVEIDVHRSLCDGVHGFRIPLDRLFRSCDRFELAGEAVPSLVLVHRILHAAYHAVLGSPEPKLMSLRDMARYLASDSISTDEVVAEARLWRGEAVLASAVGEVDSAFGRLPEGWRRWLDSVEVPASEARIISRQKREGSSFGPAKLAALRELAWRDRPAYALGVAVPSRDHLRSRDVRRLDLLGGGRWDRISRRGP